MLGLHTLRTKNYTMHMKNENSVTQMLNAIKLKMQKWDRFTQFSTNKQE